MKQSRLPMQRWHIFLALAGVALAARLVQNHSLIEAPDSDRIWHISGMLLSALIAGGAALWAAKSTMKNARELQERDLKHARELHDRERRRGEKSVAALLSADLHRRLTVLVILLEGTVEARIHGLASMSTNIKVIEAALPKLGDLGQQGAANLLNAFNGVELLARDARTRRLEGLSELTQEVALYIGRVIHTLGERYDLDLPAPLADAGCDLDAVGLQELRKLGL